MISKFSFTVDYIQKIQNSHKPKLQFKEFWARLESI